MLDIEEEDEDEEEKEKFIPPLTVKQIRQKIIKEIQKAPLVAENLDLELLGKNPEGQRAMATVVTLTDETSIGGIRWTELKA